MPRISWLPRDGHLKKNTHTQTQCRESLLLPDDGDFKDKKTREGDKGQRTKNAKEL
jgi:hypothetical protein